MCHEQNNMVPILNSGIGCCLPLARRLVFIPTQQLDKRNRGNPFAQLNNFNNNIL